MQTILLFGSTGFIGSQLMPALEQQGFKVYAPRIDVQNYSEVVDRVEDIKPDVVINATGKTGRPNVDWCETHPDETLGVNVGGSINIAEAAARHSALMVQISSGCVYDGYQKEYTEDDEPNYFGSVYSRSRILSEKALRELPNVLQLRIRIPIQGKPHPKNLIDKMKLYPAMINRMNSCTVMEDFIPAAIEFIKMKQTGVFNMTNIGAMDHVGIMTLYREIVDPNFRINLMSDAEQEALCKRRSNCVLNTDKRENLGIHMPPLEQSLRSLLETYKSYSVN